MHRPDIPAFRHPGFPTSRLFDIPAFRHPGFSVIPAQAGIYAPPGMAPSFRRKPESTRHRAWPRHSGASRNLRTTGYGPVIPAQAGIYAPPGMARHSGASRNLRATRYVPVIPALPSFRRKPESTRQRVWPRHSGFFVIPAQAGIYAPPGMAPSFRFSVIPAQAGIYAPPGMSPSFRRKPESTRYRACPRHSGASRNLRATGHGSVIPAQAGIYAPRRTPVSAGMTEKNRTT